MSRLDGRAPSLQALLVDGVATYRLTRLVTADVITEPARVAVVRAAYTVAGRERSTANDDELPPAEVDWIFHAENDDNPPRLATLVTCRWCAGVWVAGMVTVARLVAPRVWSKVAHGLACSTAAALLARLEA